MCTKDRKINTVLTISTNMWTEKCLFFLITYLILMRIYIMENINIFLKSICTWCMNGTGTSPPRNVLLQAPGSWRHSAAAAGLSHKHVSVDELDMYSCWNLSRLKYKIDLSIDLRGWVYVCLYHVWVVGVYVFTFSLSLSRIDVLVSSH